MPHRKFNIKYGPNGVETQEVPVTSAPKMSASPKRKPMPERRPFKPSQKAVTAPKPPKPAGQDRTYQVAIECAKNGIKDRPTIEQMILTRYQGSGKSAEYIAKCINRCFSMANDRGFVSKVK